MKYENGAFQPPIDREAKMREACQQVPVTPRELDGLIAYMDAWNRARRFLTEEQQAYCWAKRQSP